jgi:ribosomal protein L32
MTLNEAMHTVCTHCGEMAMNHRLTNRGNFYCLVFNRHNTSMLTIYPTIRERRVVAQRAKCDRLRKSPLSSMREVSRTIRVQWQSFIAPVGKQLSL